MVKKSILTPVLSGVLAVTVAGSGVLYYVDNKDSAKSDDAKADSSKTATVADVADNISETVETASKAIKGELDFSYNSNVEMILGDDLTSALGYDFEPVSVNTVAKQKGGKSAADITLQYDSKSLATLNLVIDNESGTAYAKIPELSDAYLSFTPEQLEALLEDSYGIDTSDLASSLTATSAASSSSTSTSTDALLNMLESMDYEALADDFVTYWDAAAEKIPDPKDNGTISGDIDGHSYEYDVKTYEITGQVAVDIINVCLDKAESDETLKGICTQAGLTESDYDLYISSLKESFDTSNMTEDDLADTILSFDCYYDGDQNVGWYVDLDGVEMKYVLIDTDDVFAIDMSVSEDGTNVATAYGSAEMSGSKVNGSFKYSINEDVSDVTEITLTLEDVEAQGDTFSGTIGMSAVYDDVAFGLTLDSNSTADKLDLSINMSADGVDYVTVNLTGEETDATDITVPSGNIYTFDEAGLESYLETCDPDGFAENAKEALGDELYSALFGSSTSGYTVDDDAYYCE